MDAIESSDPVIRERFRALVQEEQNRIQDEQLEQRRVRADELSHERVSQLAEKVRLSPEQVEWLNTQLDTEREQAGDLFAQVRRAEAGFPEVRDKVRQLRAATDERVKAQLDREQLAAYEELRAEERRRFGPPPGN